jgi:hypothetical protein
VELGASIDDSVPLGRQAQYWHSADAVGPGASNEKLASSCLVVNLCRSLSGLGVSKHRAIIFVRLGNITHVNHRVKIQLRLIKVDRVVPLLLENVLKHRSESRLVLLELVMGVGSIKLAITARLEKSGVNRVIILLC